MIILIFFAFLAGIVTILSPCILPVLPIVLSGSITGGKQRPWGVVTGFIASFTFFTLFLSAIVKATNISAEVLRSVSIIIIAGFGLSLLVPMFQVMVERLFSRFTSLLSSQTPSATRSDFVSGLLVGLSLGLLWTPCVGPILASVITLAATSKVTTDAFFITLAYSVGTAIPLLGITYGGRNILTNNPWLVRNSGRIQKGFGILMILTAIAIYFQIDRKFQTYILERFPNYGVGLTKLEDNRAVINALQDLQNPTQKKQSILNILKKDYGKAPEVITGGKWFNTPRGDQNLTIESLREKVVLIDFWTYTCINCIRTLPYLKTWYEKYKDNGLVIIGVHTPEFEFEKNQDNVARAIKDFGLTYPVMQDNYYATWNAYNNHYWPAHYLIDKTGTIRYTHFGEGDDDKTEQEIQNLLREAGSIGNDVPINNPQYQVETQTPETYLGFTRMSGLASPESIQNNQEVLFSAPSNLPRNNFAFTGTWTISEERALPSINSLLSYHFDAKDVYLVMGSNSNGSPGLVRVFLDGKPVDTLSAGEDVKAGVVSVDQNRLYKLIHLITPDEHILKLEFLDGNLELYAFTFG